MADDVIARAVGEIIVRDQTSAGINQVKTNFDRLYDTVRYNWWGIQNLGLAFGALGGVMTAGLAGAARAAINFDQGLTQVGRTADLTGKPLDELGQQLRGLALTKPVDLSKIMDIATMAGQLGIASNDIKDFTGTIIDLTATTNITEQQAVQLAKLGSVLGLTGKQYSNLGSAILYMGVHTAATERDIVDMSVRLSGAAAIAHLTASEIVAISADAISLGSSAEKGATSIQRVFLQMNKAVAEGGTDIKTFAKVAGYTGPQAVQQFAATLNRDGGKALAQFITGVGKMTKNGADTTKMLLDLGFNGQRGLQTILQLARGTQQTVNPLLNLNNALVAADAQWIANTELQKQATKVYSSTQNQLKLFKNSLTDTAVGFGQLLLPAINAVLGPLTDFVWGIDNLPGPVKAVLGATAALSGGLLLLGGAAAFLGPKVILTLGAMKAFRETMFGAQSEAKLVTAALNKQAQAAGETGRVSALQAGRKSKADREAAVAAMQDANAEKIKQINTEASARSQALGTAAAQKYSVAIDETELANLASARAAEQRAISEDLAAKSDFLGAEAAAADAMASEEDAAAHEALAAAATQASASIAARAVESDAAAAASIAQAEADAALVVAEEDASTGAYLLGIAMDAATGPFAILFIVITALIPVLGAMGKKHRDAANAARDEQQADLGLVKAIRDVAAGHADALRQYYFTNTAFLSLAQSVGAYGYNLNQLFQIITTGASGGVTMQAVIDKLAAAYANGDEEAKKVAVTLIDLYNSQRASTAAANAQAAANVDNTKAMNNETSAAQKLDDELQKQAQLHDLINNAALDMPDALLSQKEAQLQLTSAQEAYNQALDATAQHAEDVAKAENDLADAQENRVKAQYDLVDAERAAQDARRKAVENVLNAYDALKGDQSSLFDNEQKILDLEKQLNDLRNGPTTDQITEATNKYNDALLALQDSILGVSDATYNLNYLEAEGASQRDLEDAQRNLAKANQDVADKTQAAGQAQKDLNDLINGDNTVKLTQLENQLAAARRDQIKLTLQIKDDELALQRVRGDERSGRTAKEAELNLEDARRKVQQADYDVTDAERKLTEERAKNPADDVAQSEANLERAVLGVAQANTRVIIDTKELTGHQVGAGEQADILRGQLDNLNGTMTGPVHDAISKFSSYLGQATTDIDTTKKHYDALQSDLGGGKIGTPNKPINDRGLKDDGKKSGGGWWDGFKSSVASGWDEFSDYIGKSFMSNFGTPVGQFFSGPFTHFFESVPGTVGSAFSSAWDLSSSSFFNPLGSGIYSAGQGVGKFAGNAASWIGSGFSGAWGSTLTGFLNPLGGGIGSAGKTVGKFAANSSSWIGSEFGNAWTSTHDNFLAPIGAGFSTAGAHIGSFASHAGSDIGSAFSSAWDSVSGIWGKLPSFFKHIGEGAINAVIDAFNWGINELIKGWNWMVGGIADLGFHVNWGPFHAGIDLGFLRDLEIPSLTIPHVSLAQGGIAMNPMFARIGDNSVGEAVLPLDKMFTMFQPLEAMAASVQANNDALTNLAAMLGVHGGDGDTFNINGADADPLEIAEDIIWLKQVRFR